MKPEFTNQELVDQKGFRTPSNGARPELRTAYNSHSPKDSLNTGDNVSSYGQRSGTSGTFASDSSILPGQSVQDSWPLSATSTQGQPYPKRSSSAVPLSEPQSNRKTWTT